MNWLERAISYLIYLIGDPIFIVVGSIILSTIFIVAVLWAEARVRRKDD